MRDIQEQKRQVALAAIEYLRPGYKLGVGTGTTAEQFIELLPEAKVELKVIIASSERSQTLLEAKGYRVAELNRVDNLDLYVDGADEFTDRFTLIKGGGGALTREKILAAASKKFVVIVDDSKQVDVLGKFPVAVEVLPLARSLVARKLVGLGGSPTWREGFQTDEGNMILDCTGLDCRDTAALEQSICSLSGVVDCGLCALRPADIILIGNTHGAVTKLER